MLISGKSYRTGRDENGKKSSEVDNLEGVLFSAQAAWLIFSGIQKGTDEGNETS